MMPFLKHPKSSCIFLATMLILQSCVVYQKAPITFDEAVAQQRKVKMIRTNGETIKFKRIISENEVYYGIKGTKSEVIKVPLDPQDINSINVKDPTKSTVSTILISLGVGLLATFLFFASTYNSNWL